MWYQDSAELFGLHWGRIFDQEAPKSFARVASAGRHASGTLLP